jgi:hypothetical protein
MKLEIRHYGRVRGGKAIWDIPELYAQQLLSLEGKNIVAIYKELHQKPTMSQYGYYRGAILVACYQSEYFSYMAKKDDIHDEYFAPKFLSYVKLVGPPGNQKEMTFTRSLADLSKDEMKDFMEKVIGDCAENGISIPASEEFYNKYYQK